MALGDIIAYSKDNGNGYPGDVNYVVASAATVPTILSGEPVAKALGSGSFVTALASGTGATPFPQVGGPGSVYIVGVAASTSTEPSSGTGVGQVSVTPIDEPVTYLISTLATTEFFGNPSSGATLQQLQYDTKVGSRVTFTRTGGVGVAQLGGTYTINATDLTGGGLVVEELDVQKFTGKVRFSFRNGLSYKA
jgi:hypothetical protein